MKLDETKRQKIIHPIPPLYDKDSKILISGGNSFGEKTGNCRGKEGFPSQKLYCGVGCDS